jgi:PAS domain S-box-containing protein
MTDDRRDDDVQRLKDRVGDLEQEIERRDERQAAENEMLKLILESAVEYAIFTLDADGRITSWNSGAERLTGYNETDALGQDGRIVFTAEDRQRGAPEWEVEQALLEGRASNERWHVRKDGSRFWGSGIAMALQPSRTGERGVLKIMRDDTRRRHSEEQQRLLIGELNHRVKNTLTSVQAIVSQTARSAADMRSFTELVNSRIQALARAHDLLTRETWMGATLGDVARAALEPWLDGKRIGIRGPHVRLTISQALALSMAFHELAVNAVKHGALTSQAGRIDLEWDSHAELIIAWTERDGPPVSAPQRQGFGSRILNKALAVELDGDVSLSFEPDGVRCSIRVPSPGV